ncbi:hypothetical protein HKD37_12G034045 [Glycine soja]
MEISTPVHKCRQGVITTMAKKHGAFVFELMPLEEFCFRFRTSSYSGNWKPNVSKAARVLNLQCTEREAAKKSLEKATERVRCLEDDLAKSR